MWRPGYEFAAVFVTVVCIFCFASQVCINLTRDTFFVKNADEVYILLKRQCMKFRYFKLTR